MNRNHRPPSAAAFTLAELIITAAVLAVLAGLGSIILIRNIQAWGVRQAAIELAGYLENAQAISAGIIASQFNNAAINPCTLQITGSGENLSIAPAPASGGVSNACTSLAPRQLLPTSPIRIALNPPSTNSFTLQPGGIVPQTITTVLQSTIATIPAYCIQLRAPSGAVGIGIFREEICNYAAFR